MTKMHLLIAICFISLSFTTVFAQSTITLDSFELDEAQDEVAQEPEVNRAQSSSNCLLNPEASDCHNMDRSSQSFSLSDVVNLGIVARDEFEVEDSDGNTVKIEDRMDPLRSIDLEVLFDYDSATLRTDQMAPLISLSRDLSEINFERAQLVLMGHTDSVGSASYNRELSHRRAQSVAAFLSETSNIPLSKIKTSGMGFDYPKDSNHPESEINRRVQVLLIEM